MGLPKRSIKEMMKAETTFQVSDLASEEMQRFLEALLIWLTRQASMRTDRAGRRRLTAFDVIMSEKLLVSAIEGLV